MIRINHVDDKPYQFPTIDFKFQNTGSATAFLWQFAIGIKQAEIDPAPALEFREEINNNRLTIFVTDHGWGSSNKCSIQLIEPTINYVFPKPATLFDGTLTAGNKTTILVLDKANANAARAIASNFSNISGS